MHRSRFARRRSKPDAVDQILYSVYSLEIRLVTLRSPRRKIAEDVEPAGFASELFDFRGLFTVHRSDEPAESCKHSKGVSAWPELTYTPFQTFFKLSAEV